MNKVFVIVLLAIGTATAYAGTPAAEETTLSAVGVTQKIGEKIPLDLQFTDQDGVRLSLAELTAGRPTLLELAWYDCPMLCDLSLRRLGSRMAATDDEAGRDYAVLLVSIDPQEPPAAVAKADALMSSSYGDSRAGTWQVLTGDADSVQALAASIGFHYRYDADSHQFAHPAGLAVLTGDGTISSYLLGLSFTGRDLQLALTRAGRGEPGNAVKQFVLRCFHFDPQTGRYTLDVLRVVNLACIATALVLAVLIGTLLWRRRHGTATRGARK